MSSIQDRMLEGVRGLLEEAGDGPLLKALRLIESLDERGSLDEAVARVRPRLALLRPIRSIGLRRLATLPFEDLLVSSAAWVPGRCRIDRASLGRLHMAILGELPSDLPTRIRAESRNRFMNEQGVVLALGRELWPAASAALHRSLAAAGAAGQEPGMIEQMRSAALLLGVAPAVVPLIWRLPPRPMPELVEDERKVALDLLRFGRAGGAALLELLFHILLARTASPATILELPFAGELAIPPREIEPLVERAAAACLAELAVPPASGSQGRALALAADGIERMVSWVRSLEAGPARLGLDRAALRDARGRVVRSIGSQLKEVVVGSLPQQFARLHGTEAAADNVMAEVEEAARAVRRIGIAGREFGIGDTVDRTLAQAQALFLGPSSASDGDPGRIDRARIVEILFGPDAAMTVMRPAGTGG